MQWNLFMRNSKNIQGKNKMHFIDWKIMLHFKRENPKFGAKKIIIIYREAEQEKENSVLSSVLTTFLVIPNSFPFRSL